MSEQTIRILIVDDQIDSCDALAEWLQRKEKMIVETTRSGEDALFRIIKTGEKYDVIVLDKVLPGIDGIETMLKIKDFSPKTPCILMTGVAPENGIMALSSGAFRYMIKPIVNEELAAVIRSLAEKDFTLGKTAISICQLLDVPICIIWGLNRSKGRFEITAWNGNVDHFYRDNIFIKRESPIIRRFLEKGEPIYVSNVTNSKIAPRYQHRSEAVKRKWVSLLSSPMIVDGQVIGIIDVYSMRPKRFTQEEIRLLGVLGDHAGNTMRNSRMFERSQALLEINKNITGIFNADEVIKLIFCKGLELVGTNTGWLWLVDRGLGKLTISHHQGVVLRKHQLVRDLELRKGITGWVARNGKALNIPNVEADTRFLSVEGPKIRSEIAVPLKSGNEVIGVLAAKSTFRNAFTNDDLYLLETFAFQATIALENAKQHEELSALFEISSKIAQEQNVDTVLRDTVKHAIVLLGAKRGGVYIPVPCEEKLKIELVEGFGKDLKGLSIKYGEGMAGKVFQSGRPMRLPDPALGLPSYNEWDERAKDLDKYEFTAVLEVPLKAKDRLLGVLFVADNVEERIFSDKDEILLERFADQVSIILQKASRIEELETLNEISNALNAEIDHKALVDLILNNSQRIIAYKTAVIALMDKNTGIIHYRRFLGNQNGDSIFSSSVSTKIRGKSITRWVIRNNHSIIINDVKNIPFIPGVKDQPKYYKLDLNTKSELCVPLRVDDEVIGAFNIESPLIGAFIERDLEILEQLAEFLAAAINKSNLIETISRQRNDLTVINGIGRLLWKQKELQEIPKILIKELILALRVEAGTLWEINRKTKRLDHKFSFYGDGKDTGWYEKQKNLPPDFFSLENGVIGRVARTGKPRIIKDISKDKYWDDRLDKVTSFNTRSIMAIPLSMGTETRFVIDLRNRPKEDPFSLEDLDYAKAIASVGVLAVENSRLLDNHKHRIRDLEIVSKVVSTINSKLSQEKIIQTIVSQIANRLDCSHCTAFFPEKIDRKTYLVPQFTNGGTKQHMDRKFEENEGVVGLVYNTGKSLIFDDASLDPHFADARRNIDKPRSMLVSPIKAGDQIIGVIVADKNEYGWFDKTDLNLVEALAIQSGVAISRARGLGLLLNINNEIIDLQQARDVNEILRQVVSGAIKITNSDNAIIYLVSEDGRSLLENFHPSNYQHPRPRLETREGLTRQVISNGRIIPIPNIQSDDRVNPVLKKRFKSLIAVPLTLEGKVIGVLYLNDINKHVYSEIEISLLRTLVGQASIAIKNARLLKIETKQTQQVEALQSIGIEIISQSGLKEVLGSIVKNIKKLLGADFATLFTYDSAQNRFEPGIWIGKDGEPSLPSNSGIAARIAQSKKPIYIDDVDKDIDFKSEFVRENGIKSYAGIPLLGREKLVVGVLYVNYNKSHPFTKGDKSLLKQFVVQAAIATDNARLLDREMKRSQQLTSLQEIGVQLVSLPNIDSVLGSIADQANMLTGAESSTVFIFDPYRDHFLDIAIRRGTISEQPKRPTNKSLATALVRGKVAVFVHDAKSKYASAFIHKYDVRALAGIPLLVRGTTAVGMLFVNYLHDHSFNEEEKQLILLLANQAAVAIENVIERNDLRTRLVNAERLLLEDKFVTSYVHKVKNCIGTIPIRVEQIKSKIPNEVYKEIRPQLDGILSDTRGVDPIIDNLAGRTRQKINREETVDIIDTLARAARKIRIETSEDIKIVENYPKNLRSIVKTVPWDLSDAFWNVMKNGIEAMRADGSGTLTLAVSKTTKDEKQWIHISIHNTGKTIPEDIRNKIFEPFFSTKEEGSGYGLWRTRNVINNLGGCIYLEDNDTKITKGTQFVILLPADTTNAKKINRG